jgi:hypothetical protein
MKKIIPFLSALALFISIVASSQTIRERIQERRAGKSRQATGEQCCPGLFRPVLLGRPPGQKRYELIPFLPLSVMKKEIHWPMFFSCIPPRTTKDMRNSMWNADLQDTELNNATDLRTILFQSTVFNNCCRVFAPRYRQAHLKAYMAPKSEASQTAFDLAYNDPEDGFSILP